MWLVFLVLSLQKSLSDVLANDCYVPALSFTIRTPLDPFIPRLNNRKQER